MTWAYATATSAEQGACLPFRIGGGPSRGIVRVEDAVSGAVSHAGGYAGDVWELTVDPGLRSSLYRAVFGPRRTATSTAYFAVRRADQARAPALLSVPFATWQAYNRAGVPGESIYWTEQPSRASSVSFDRPGGGPPPEQWELPMMRWLRVRGLDVDYCSDLDLHLDPSVVEGYRLLIVAGHDEYWTWQMRDTVESFVQRGGNLAIFGGNTCWWQIRLDELGRTMTCYRDALADPVVRTGRPELATVEWSSAPVGRPENTMTGLSFRLGAGCWERMAAMAEEAYTARFTDHWVFEGTGLADGDRFGLGSLGYETDAADIDHSGGVPRITGRDGTPASFTVLATADLRHWAAYGQGGAATMGVFTSGRGTVFNAGTVNWGAALGDPVVARITGNVLDRFTGPGRPWPDWEPVGSRAPIRALASAGAMVYAIVGDAAGTWFLGARAAGGQNMPWQPIGEAGEITALASPRDAVPGAPAAIYGACRDGVIVQRPAEPISGPWTRAGMCPQGACGLTVANNHFFLLDSSGKLWSLPQGEVRMASSAWEPLGDNLTLIALTSLNGRLIAVDRVRRLLGRLPTVGAVWDHLGDSGGCTVMTGHAGALYGTGPGLPLLRGS
jgi:hypothetical protein